MSRMHSTVYLLLKSFNPCSNRCMCWSNSFFLVEIKSMHHFLHLRSTIEVNLIFVGGSWKANYIYREGEVVASHFVDVSVENVDLLSFDRSWIILRTSRWRNSMVSHRFVFLVKSLFSDQSSRRKNHLSTYDGMFMILVLHLDTI